MPSILEDERQQVKKANASKRPPVVFVHGLWLLPSSWDRWAELFAEAGYEPLTPGWPDDPETVEEARAHPEAFAHKTIKQVADHFADIIKELEPKPAIIGHSFGGLLTQILAGRGLAAVAVAVAVDPAPFRGVLPLPVSALRSASPVLGNPANRNRAVPLLFISGEKDHTVSPATVIASYNQQKDNPSVTEFVSVPNRGHSLTIDGGWREVAEMALDFVKRFLPALRAEDAAA